MNEQAKELDYLSQLIAELQEKLAQSDDRDSAGLCQLVAYQLRKVQRCSVAEAKGASDSQ